MRAARVPFYFLEGGEAVTALRRIVHRGDAVRHRFRAQRVPNRPPLCGRIQRSALPHRFRGFHRIREPRDLKTARSVFVAGCAMFNAQTLFSRFKSPTASVLSADGMVVGRSPIVTTPVCGNARCRHGQGDGRAGIPVLCVRVYEDVAGRTTLHAAEVRASPQVKHRPLVSPASGILPQAAR